MWFPLEWEFVHRAFIELHLYRRIQAIAKRRQRR